jgi:membrane-bound lytic murein transglycosylase F
MPRASPLPRRRAAKLPAWRRHFQSAQDLTGIDWRLLAALAYQESQWDPLATSYTNVRGMMMLTEDTADFLRVGTASTAQESIRAGARYLAQLVEQVPGAELPDRLSGWPCRPTTWAWATFAARVPSPKA